MKFARSSFQPRESRASRLARARICGVTPDHSAPALLDLVERMIDGGVDMVQLRHKTMGRGALFDLARQVAERCAQAEVLLIVNDHVDICAESGADGVHVGSDDLSIAGARAVLGPEFLIGATAATLALVRSAQKAGADYIGAGPAFVTRIKPDRPIIGPVGIAALAATVDLPVFAIGGIDPGGLAQLRTAGVDRVCAITAFSGPNTVEVARGFREELRS
ncbi:MAG TPA: thiamine phosphate synthase [Candidatus Dormibacteraeota bacterium]|jgi:thiamine-phosphate pyrophosphorylase|nr:thiamine phosphate synthase [Candidatus Dormibacteraeota bacterium]